MRFSDLVEINPRVSLSKNKEYPFIEMEIISPGRRYATARRKRVYKGGGSKFQAGDTLFARITPCLENGKIAQFKGLKEEFAFGSTEFFVFRHKEDISDPAYIFYLALSDIIRKPAEKSMSGASGRQRADIASIQDLNVSSPSLHTQRKIAYILSTYDDLIENNLRRIKILEEMAQLIYQEWFVHFRFPGHEKVKMVDSPLGNIPEGWEVTILEQILEVLESGSRPKGGIDPDVNEVPSIGAENILGLGKYDYSKEKYVSREFYTKMSKGYIKSGDVLLYKDGAKIGRKSLFRDGFPHKECCINEHVFILRTNWKCNQTYLYFWLDQPEMTAKIISLNSNAAQPGINQKGIKRLPILLPNPEHLNYFDNFAEPLLGELFNLAKKNQILQKTRDLLLPKLISGEIDVEKIEINTERAET